MKLDTNEVNRGYPRLIQSRWQGLPSDIDAALSFPARRKFEYSDENQTFSEIILNPEQFFFFKGPDVYSYIGDSKQLAEGFPTSIRTCFQGIPDEVDAAFQWSGNGMIYFIKGKSVTYISL